jgi:hypothetical protein
MTATNSTSKQEYPEPISARALVVATCRAIATDCEAPAAARVQAARTLAEMLGLLGRAQAGAIDAGEEREAEMSAAELDREIQRLRKA